LYPGAEGTPAQNSLGFLASDLAKNVRASGRAVVLYFHYDFIRENFWEPEEKDAFYDVVKDYNIIAIIHGHRHLTNLESSTWNGINVFNVAMRSTGKFTIFRIRKNHLLAAECTSVTTWGRIFTKNIVTYSN
jgi:cytolysin (calcineurin-like family phosphatase)